MLVYQRVYQHQPDPDPGYPMVSHDEWLIGSPKVQELELLLPSHRTAAAVGVGIFTLFLRKRKKKLTEGLRKGDFSWFSSDLWTDFYELIGCYEYLQDV